MQVVHLLVLYILFYVRIMCNTKVHLAVDQKNIVKLSNWIRHVKLCVQEKEGKDKGGKKKGQLALTKYFSGHST